ncbi:MAG: SH3 domain-containing protein [Deltaproteobacteria bacterium]|nr:SH3 domain-containing protein [Deltaproteobacteria bacterium]
MSSYLRSPYKKFIILAATLLLLCGAEDTRGADVHPIGIVATEGLAVQSEPGRKGLLQKTLKKGTEIKIIKRRQGWLQILHEGEVGFIRDQAQFIKIIPKKMTDTAEKQSTQLNDQHGQVDIIESRQKHIRSEIEKGRQEVEAFRRKESDIIKRLNQVEQALNVSRKRTAA